MTTLRRDARAGVDPALHLGSSLDNVGYHPSRWVRPRIWRKRVGVSSSRPAAGHSNVVVALPSLIHCSAVPRQLYMRTTARFVAVSVVTMKPTRGNSSPRRCSTLVSARRRRSHGARTTTVCPEGVGPVNGWEGGPRQTKRG